MPRTIELIMKLREDVGRYWLMRRVAEDHGHEHDVIVAALRDGDSTRAENWLRSHLSTVSTELQRLILEDSSEDA
jgi:DNA-binding GntR family transcriptional regulator